MGGSAMTRTQRRRALLCLFGATCQEPIAEWRFLPWATMRGGLVTGYCRTHLTEADRCGAVPVTCDWLPRLKEPSDAR